MNENVEHLMKYLEIAEDIGCEKIYLRRCDLVLLNSVLETYKEKEKQLKDLIVNLTKEIEEIEL